MSEKSLGIGPSHVSSSNVIDDSEVLGKEEVSPKVLSNTNPGQSGQDIVNNPTVARNVIKTAQFVNDTRTFDDLNPDFKKAIDNLNMPRPSNTFRNMIGRLFLKFANLFQGVFSSSVLSTPDKLAQLRNKQPMPLYEDPNGIKKIPMLSFDVMGKIVGVQSESKIEWFPVPEQGTPQERMMNCLFAQGNGSPRLADIKQNPELQDCWFLSSIGAVLSTQGEQGIVRLFSPSDTPGFVNVRLGSNVYEVPMGKICSQDGSFKFGSNSAPWVVALENAMAMHIAVDRSSYEDMTAQSVRYPMKDSALGIKTLLGYPQFKLGDYGANYLENMELREQISMIKNAINSGEPAVLGHKGGAWEALFDGVAPKHAVTLLSFEENTTHPEKSKVKVLDPYGKVKTLSTSALKNCVLYKNNTIKSANSGEAKGVSQEELQAEINREKDDW